MEEGIWKDYLAILISTFVFFWIVIYAWKLFFDKVWAKPDYLSKPISQKWFYVQNFAGNVHHIMIFTYVAIVYLKFDPLATDENFMKNRKEYVYGIMFTSGYILYDGIVQYFYCGDAQDLLTLVMWHHVIVFLGMMCSVVAGYGFVSGGFIGLTVEISTVFLNYRCLYQKTEMGKPIFKFISISFFLTYTIFRIILGPLYTYFFIKSAYLTWGQVTLFQNVCMVIAVICTLLFYVLQVHWYRLIMIGLFKMLGCIKSKK
jgi:hypothetical protein